jgi:hypothetical protein
MRIQIVSDLHLETREKTTFETFIQPGLTDTLALLGDIAPIVHQNLPKFLEWCSERWKTVLYVPGSLECFSWVVPNSVEDAIEQLRKVCAPYKNIHVLFRDAFYSEDGVLVLGCPFWSFSPTAPKIFRELHRGDLNWIKSMTTRYTNRCIVLSHYGPVEWVHHEYGPEDPKTSPIFTETELLLREPIVVWAFGHCHSYIEYTKTWSVAGGIPQEVLLVCNGMGPPRGPLSRPPLEDYRRDAIIRILGN